MFKFDKCYIYRMNNRLWSVDCGPKLHLALPLVWEACSLRIGEVWLEFSFHFMHSTLLLLLLNSQIVPLQCKLYSTQFFSERFAKQLLFSQRRWYWGGATGFLVCETFTQRPCSISSFSSFESSAVTLKFPYSKLSVFNILLPTYLAIFFKTCICFSRRISCFTVCSCFY